MSISPSPETGILSILSILLIKVGAKIPQKYCWGMHYGAKVLQLLNEYILTEIILKTLFRKYLKSLLVVRP